MKQDQKTERRLQLLKITEKLHGSGIDAKWLIDDTSQGMWLKNSFHCMDQHGYYCGWADFSYFFAWNSKLTDFRLRFHGPQAHYLARKHDLRPYLEDSMVHFLPDETQPGMIQVKEGSPNE